MATGKHRAPSMQRQKVGSVVAAGAVPLVMALIGTGTANADPAQAAVTQPEHQAGPEFDAVAPNATPTWASRCPRTPAARCSGRARGRKWTTCPRWDRCTHRPRSRRCRRSCRRRASSASVTSRFRYRTSCRWTPRFTSTTSRPLPRPTWRRSSTRSASSAAARTGSPPRPWVRLPGARRSVPPWRCRSR